MLTKEEILEPLEILLRDELRKEWVAQGHSMGGKAIEEIDFVSKATADTFSLEVWLPNYGYFLDKGVKAEQIPFSGRSGHGGKSAYIQGLIRYVQKRMGIQELSEAKSVAFAIAHTHKREGMPSIGSERFSKTGERTRWFTNITERKESLIRQTIYRLVELVLMKNWDKMLNKYIQLYKSV